MKIYTRIHTSHFSSWALRLGIVALLLFVIALWAHRNDYLVTPRFIQAMGAAFVLAALAVLSAIAAFIRIWRRDYTGFHRAVFGLFLGLMTLSVPAWGLYQARQYPPINDISTDLVDRPQYQTLRRARMPQPDTRALLAAQRLQRRAYGHVSPRRYPLDPGETFDLLVEAAHGEGWRIVRTRKPGRGVPGMLEATARTGLFAFVDDIVLRVVALDEESLVDMRSRSRYGVSDLGVNARRIAAFLDRLDAVIGERTAVRQESAITDQTSSLERFSGDTGSDPGSVYVFVSPPEPSAIATPRATMSSRWARTDNRAPSSKRPSSPA